MHWCARGYRLYPLAYQCTFWLYHIAKIPPRENFLWNTPTLSCLLPMPYCKHYTYTGVRYEELLFGNEWVNDWQSLLSFVSNYVLLIRSERLAKSSVVCDVLTQRIPSVQLYISRKVKWISQLARQILFLHNY